MGHNCRVEINALTKSEFDHLLQEANFSEDQERVFRALNRDTCYDYGIMNELGMSSHRYYYVKKIVIDKCVRIATANGYFHIIRAVEPQHESASDPQ